ncbi:hypothetical protein ABNF65_24145, partial [Paenibacillus larvae]
MERSHRPRIFCRHEPRIVWRRGICANAKLEIRAGRDQAESYTVRTGSITKGVRAGIPGVPAIPKVPDLDGRLCTIVYGKPDTSAGACGEEDRGAGDGHIGAIIVALEGGVQMTKVAELSSDLATLTA